MGLYFENKKGLGLRTKPTPPRAFKAIHSELAIKILKLLVKKPMYSREIAEELKVSEQKIYYHIKRLEEEGFITEDSWKEIRGAMAKYYTTTAPSFTLLLEEPKRLIGFGNVISNKINNKILKKKNTKKKEREKTIEENSFEPFITDGTLNSIIVVGSPDPHGPYMARARDGHFAVDLAFFLGSFLIDNPGLKTKLDIEFREEDYQNNLIMIGGPIVNLIAEKVHKKLLRKKGQQALPIYFKTPKIITSRITGKEYDEGPIGIVMVAENPFAHKKKILLIAGNSYRGTRAAIIAFTKHFEEFKKGNKHDKKTLARIIGGKDLDGDGVIDEIEFLE